MIFTRLRRAGGVALAAAGLAVLIWGLWAASQVVRVVPISYAALPGLPAGWESLPVPGSLANGEFSLQWPAWAWQGDEGKLRLQLAAAGSENACVEDQAGSAFTLVGRLELPGALALPGKELAQPITACRPVFQAWAITPLEGGRLAGNLWLHLRAAGLPPGTKPEQAVAAVPLEIQVISPLGLSGAQVRLVGVLAILVGLVLNIDLLVRRS